jgi:hypothetical protein
MGKILLAARRRGAMHHACSVNDTVSGNNSDICKPVLAEN